MRMSAMRLKMMSWREDIDMEETIALLLATALEYLQQHTPHIRAKATPQLYDVDAA